MAIIHHPSSRYRYHCDFICKIIRLIMLALVSSRSVAAWTTASTTIATKRLHQIESKKAFIQRSNRFDLLNCKAKTLFGASKRYQSTTTEAETNHSHNEEEITNSTVSIPSKVSKTRLSSKNLFLDLRTIANNLDIVISHLESRKSSEETIGAAKTIASLTDERVSLIQQRDNALQKRKELSAVVGALMRLDSRTDAQEIELNTAKEQSSQAAADAEIAESQLSEIQSRMDLLLANIPNLLDDIVPEGNDDKDNIEVYSWGDVTTMPSSVKQALNDIESDAGSAFVPKLHDDIAYGLGGYQAEAAVKMSGSRFVALSGAVAQLERALAMFFLDHHVTVGGYTEVSVPFIVSRSALEGTSQLPKFQQDLFAISPESHTCNGEDAFLIPTAEVPVTNLHRDSVLEEEDLPLSYVAWTPCFRSEAGSYGRDTKGLIRQHQFHKVELVKITTPETSDAQHELLTEHAESCLRLLELPYRKVRLCSGDIGFSARHCYDLEVWLPGAGEYREISSCSNTGDFQARRMSLKYRPKSVDKKKSKPQFCHTINGSGLAVGRTLVAVLENYQLPDGSLIVPDVLRPYMRGTEVIRPPTNS